MKILNIFPLPIIHQRTTSVFSDTCLVSVYVYVQVPVKHRLQKRAPAFCLSEEESLPPAMDARLVD